MDKKLRREGIAIFVFMVAFVSYGVRKAGPQNFLNLLGQISYTSAVLGVLCIVVYLLLEAAVLHVILKKLYPRQHFWRTVQVALVGQFFNNVTPFSSGGQPMQAYALAKGGVPLGTATTGLLGKFIIYQIVQFMYTLIVLLSQLSYFTTQISSFALLALLGFSVNLASILFLISIAFFHQGLKRLGKKLLGAVERVGLRKKDPQRLIWYENFVDQFKKDFDYLIRQRSMLFFTGVLTTIQLTAYLVIPYVIHRSMGFPAGDFYHMLGASTFVMLIATYAPVPGTIGVSEGSFAVLFSLFFPRPMLFFAVLFWRIYTFYLPLILGATVYLLPTKVEQRRREGKSTEKSVDEKEATLYNENNRR